MGKADLKLVGDEAPYMVRDIRMVDAREVPAIRGYWKALAYDLQLRLEKTPDEKALRLEFIGLEYAQRAAGAMYYHFRKLWGAGWVKLRLADEDGHGVMYVQRGKAFGIESKTA